MVLPKKKLVTIIAPEGVEDDLVEALTEIVPGLSILTAHGTGAHGPRPSRWQTGNAQIETVVAPGDVDRVLGVLDRFPKDMALVAWLSDVEAWPPAKFA